LRLELCSYLINLLCTQNGTQEEETLQTMVLVL